MSGTSVRKRGFITGRLLGVGFAVRGAVRLLTTEHSIMVQAVIAVIVTIAGFLFGISRAEWMFQIFAIALVMTAEGLNTAIEKTCDFFHPQYHDKIGFIKDISAGAVFLAASAAVLIGLIIYVPKFI